MGRIKIQASQSRMEWVPLPRGTYDLQVDSVEEKPSQSGNAPQLVFKMSVIDGPSAGKKATHFQSLSEKSGGFIRELVEAAGIEHEAVESDTINEEDGKPFLIIDFESDDFIGRTFRADAIISEYNGKESNKFNRFRSLEADEAPAPAAEPAKTRTAPATQQRGAAAPAAGAARTQQGGTRAAAPAGNQQRRSRV